MPIPLRSPLSLAGALVTLALLTPVLVTTVALPAQARVIDFHPNSSDPFLVALGADLYVAALTSTSQGRRLFRYNSSLTVPVGVNDQATGQPIVSVHELTVVGSRLFCKGNVQGLGPTLWMVDPQLGYVARQLMATGSDPQQLAGVGTRLFFSAEIPNAGRELCVSDGSSTGTRMVKDIRPGGPSDPTHLTAYRDRVVFRATDGANGLEPWISDGTAAGTFMLRNVRPSGSSDPTEFTVSGSYCYFSAGDGTGRELWRTDGSTAETRMMTVRVGSGESDPTALADFGGTLFFTANGGIGQGFELWKLASGATTATTAIDVRPGTNSSQPAGTKTVGDLLWFSAIQNNEGRELFAYAPALPLGATNPRVLTLNPGSGDGVRLDPLVTPLGGGAAIAFVGTNGSTGYEPWTSSGTTTRLLGNISLPGSSDPDQFTVLGDELFFAATDQGVHGREVWAVPLAGTGTATWQRRGAACARSGNVFPSLALSGDPRLGTNVNLIATGAVPLGGVVLAGSMRATSIPFGPCTWVLDPSPTSFFMLPSLVADSLGAVRLPLPIPPYVYLVGRRFAFQGLVVELGGPMLGAGALTNGIELFLGQ